MMQNKESLLILGASGHGKVVADIAQQLAYDEIVFADDNPELSVVAKRWPVQCTINWQAIEEMGIKNLALGVGNNALRQRWYTEGLQRGFVFPALIHPSASVSALASIAAGCVIGPQAVVNIGAEIAPACIVNSGAVVEHDCIVAAACHISPNACLAGGVHLFEQVWVGMGAQILPCLSVASQSVIAAGAVLIHDLVQTQTVAGVPAKVIGQ